MITDKTTVAELIAHRLQRVSEIERQAAKEVNRLWKLEDAYGEMKVAEFEAKFGRLPV